MGTINVNHLNLTYYLNYADNFFIFYILYNELMSQETTLALIAIVAALGLLGIIVVESISITPQQQADARGCNNGVAFNASQGRCFGH
jgi:hypothetical protein